MSNAPSGPMSGPARYQREEWGGVQPPRTWGTGAVQEAPRSAGSSNGLLIAAAALVAVGFLGWYYLGPDLVRYMKIRDM